MMSFQKMMGVACLGAALVACGAARAEPGVEPGKILLGGTNALTGPNSALCGPVSYGALAWIAHVNKTGGVHGRQIDYKVLDDAYSPQRGSGNVRRLLEQDNVMAIFGGCSTATASAILSFLQTRTDIPYLFPYAGMTEMTKPTKKAIFALFPDYVSQLRGVVPYAIKHAETKPKTAAMLSMNVPGVEDWRASTRKVFQEQGVEVIYDDVFDVTAADRNAYVIQIKNKAPDMVVIVDSASGGARSLLDMQRQNWLPKTVSGGTTLTAEQFLEPAAAVAESRMVVPGLTVPPTAPEAKACNDSLQESYKSDVKPSHFTLYGCLTAIVMVEGLNRAGPEPTREKLIAAFEGMRDFKSGISGPISFSADDHLGLKTVLPFGVKEGKFVVLGDPLPFGDAK